MGKYQSTPVNMMLDIGIANYLLGDTDRALSVWNFLLKAEPLSRHMVEPRQFATNLLKRHYQNPDEISKAVERWERINAERHFPGLDPKLFAGSFKIVWPAIAAGVSTRMTGSVCGTRVSGTS